MHACNQGHFNRAKHFQSAFVTCAGWLVHAAGAWDSLHTCSMYVPTTASLDVCKQHVAIVDAHMLSKASNSSSDCEP